MPRASRATTLRENIGRGLAMKSRPTFAVFAGALAALVLAAVASAAAAPKASLLIRHQVRGCHTWSLNGGPFKASQSVSLRVGATVTITNNDLMAQELVKTSGPAAQMKLVKQGTRSMGMTMHMGKAGRYTMAHMGAVLRVTFPRAGTYTFKLVDRGDYMEVKTVGPDNKPTLKVVVS